MNRQEKIEKAAQALVDAYGVGFDVNTVHKMDALREALKPELDWSKARFGDTVTDKFGLTGEFVYYYKGNRLVFVLLKDGQWDEWYEDDCTFESNPYTEVVWHDWPEDGRKPKWVMGADKILVIHNRASRYVNARNLTWSDKRGKFAVIREDS